MKWAQALDYICSHVCNKIHFSCRFIYNVDVSLNTLKLTYLSILVVFKQFFWLLNLGIFIEYEGFVFQVSSIQVSFKYQ